MKKRWAHSPMVEHFVCNEETRVRFTVGPFKPLKGLIQMSTKVDIIKKRTSQIIFTKSEIR